MHNIVSKLKILFLILISLFSLIITINIDFDNQDLIAEVFACEPGECSPSGAVSNQGCAANGCPVGTRRVCSCIHNLVHCPNEGAWSCQCVADAACNVPTTTTTGATGAPPPPPSCTPTNPRRPILIAPADGAVLTTTSTTFTWNLNGNYGTGCPSNNNRVRVYLRAPNVDGTCTGSGSGWNLIANLGQNNTSFAYNGLTSGSEYCWLVQKTNGSNSANSGRNKFSVSAGPTINSSGIASGQVCSTGNAIGIFNPDPVTRRTSNPVTFNVSATNSGPDTLYGVFIGFVPRSVNDNTLNDYTLTASQSEVNGAGILYNFETQTAAVRNGGNWNTFAASGDLTSPNGRITVLDINTNTNTTFSAGNVNSNFQLRFNNVAQGSNSEWNDEYNLYVSVLMRAADSSIYSNDTSALSPTQARKTGSFILDTVPPSSQVQSNLVTQQNFNVTWNGNDGARALKSLSSYIYTLSDNSYALDRFAPGGGSLGPILIQANTELTIADTPNAGANVSNHTAGAFNYSTGVSSDLDELTLRSYTEDLACNISSVTQKLAVQEPWILTLGNDTSGRTGIYDFAIPDKDINLQETGFNGPAIFSNDFVLGGSGSFISEKVSSINLFVTNYLNNAVSPITADSSATQAWYDYLLDLVQRNNKTQISTLSQDTISGNISTSLSGIANNKRVWIINPSGGTVLILKNTVCDVQGLIFINGNLNIDPDFTNSNASNGCIFVVKNNITIGKGDRKTNVEVTSETLATSDRIEALLFTDSTLTIQNDSFGTGDKWDSFVLEGGVYAKDIDLARDLNLNANLIQPAITIKFNPKYRELFRLDLAQRRYSLREIRD